MEGNPSFYFTVKKMIRSDNFNFNNRKLNNHSRLNNANQKYKIFFS